MKVKWEVEDGYIGKSRPHYVIIPDDELNECDNEREREDLIYEYLQNDFEEKVTYSWEIVDE